MRKSKADVKYDVKMSRADGRIKIEKFANRGAAADFAASSLMMVIRLDPAISIDKQASMIIESEPTMHVTLVKGGDFVCKIEAYPS